MHESIQGRDFAIQYDFCACIQGEMEDNSQFP